MSKMKEVDMSDILKHAEECNRKKVKWHFHILTPDCAFSRNKRYSIVFEREKAEHLIAFFKEKPPRQEKLEILFHGRA